MKHKLLIALIALSVTSCSKAETQRVSATEITKVQLSEVPKNVGAVEVLKKVRDGRVYYDVEGELPNGEEIEFDVLMTTDGPEIVEIQRDLSWSDVPQQVRSVVNDANEDNLKIARIIESAQADGFTIIYEIFVANEPADPRFEVSFTDTNQAKLLSTRWKH